MMKKTGLLTLVVLAIFAASCAKQETTAANADTGFVNSNVTENADQKPEKVSAPKGLKPTDQCGWFEKSLQLKAQEYKQSSSMPDLYYCVQVKPLANHGSFEYHVIGDAETIKKFFVYVRFNERHTAKQKEASHKLLALAAMEVADRASGNKLTEEILAAILSGETKEFTLAPGADRTKLQLKTVSVENEQRPDGWTVRTATLEF